MIEQLTRSGIAIENWIRVANEREFQLQLVERQPDLILADYYVPSVDIFKVLSSIRDLANKTAFIVVSGAISEENAGACFQFTIGDPELEIPDRRSYPEADVQ